MGAETSAVRKQEWNPMAGEEEWMDKQQDMEGEGKGDGHNTGVAQDTRASPIA